jgi:hypothetical protein
MCQPPPSFISQQLPLTNNLPAGVLADPAALSAGHLQFTWPTLKGGLRIMIHSKTHSGSMWGFLGGFHWSVWLALNGTTIGVGLLIGFFEWMNTASRPTTAAHHHKSHPGSGSSKKRGEPRSILYPLLYLMSLLSYRRHLCTCLPSVCQ